MHNTLSKDISSEGYNLTHLVKILNNKEVCMEIQVLAIA